MAKTIRDKVADLKRVGGAYLFVAAFVEKQNMSMILREDLHELAETGQLEGYARIFEGLTPSNT